jgi:hypothetical protein
VDDIQIFTTPILDRIRIEKYRGMAMVRAVRAAKEKVLNPIVQTTRDVA